MIIFEDFHFVLNCLCHQPSVTLIPFIGYHYVVDYQYNPIGRRGGRDLYPSVHGLFMMLDSLSERLHKDSYSYEIVMRTMASKIPVVIGQTSSAATLVQKRKPFVQISKDEVLKKHLPLVLQYAGGRYRLQHRCTLAGFPLLAYLFFKVLK